MKKKYKEQEEKKQEVRESIPEYDISRNVDMSQLPFMFMEEVHKRGMSLENSKQRILKKIHSDFHKI